ncbi:TBCD [Symbiodinium pilosum]|uniref:TBCD protein n=1 Tax=Symbiodinium pilosum TaxID=2952 RepID=A0A812TQG7_SYMPI|nr:TBCD [Symbiodinium pilosum]
MKALAHAVKSLSLGWVHEIDTAPPAYYARRFKTPLARKVQTFREPEDRVTRFVRRLRLGIENGTVPCPTFVSVERPRAETDPARGGQLLVARRGLLRSRAEEVEAFLDMDRHALIFQEMARRPYARGRRPTSLVACYKIRRVYLTIVCYRKIEAEPPESRRFTVADDEEPLRFTAPSRRQAKLWVTALEVAAGYVESNVEDVREAQAAALVSSASGRPCDVAFLSKPASAVRAALLGSLDFLLEDKELAAVLSTARQARHGLLEPYLLGPEAERRWQKRRLKWIFGFVDADGTGALSIEKINLLWHEMNINEEEGQQVLTAFLREERQGRRSGGGRQIGSGQVFRLQDWTKMLSLVDSAYVKAVHQCVRDHLQLGRAVSRSSGSMSELMAPNLSSEAPTMQVTAADLAGFFAAVQGVWPPPSEQQVERLIAPPCTPLQAAQPLC